MDYGIHRKNIGSLVVFLVPFLAGEVPVTITHSPTMTCIVLILHSSSILRPLIPARMRAEYNSLLPSIPNYEQKVYHIKRKGSEPLGITVRGGFEFGCGVFVSSVQPSSRGLQAGLKVSLQAEHTAHYC